MSILFNENNYLRGIDLPAAAAASPVLLSPNTTPKERASAAARRWAAVVGTGFLTSSGYTEENNGNIGDVCPDLGVCLKIGDDCPEIIPTPAAESADRTASLRASGDVGPDEPLN